MHHRDRRYFVAIILYQEIQLYSEKFAAMPCFDGCPEVVMPAVVMAHSLRSACACCLSSAVEELSLQ